MDAHNLYSAGIGPEYYPEQTWLNYNPTQTAAFDMTLDQAGSNKLNKGASDTLWNVMDKGGVSDYTWGAVQPLHDIAEGKNKITTAPQYESLLQRSAAGNPYWEQALNNQLDRTDDQVNAQFSAAGRYGSGAHTGVLADRIGEARTNAMAQQYNQDIQNQMQGLLGLSNVQGTNITNQGNSALQLGQIYQGAQQDSMRAAGMSPAMSQAQYDDIMRVAQVGDAYSAMDQKKLDDSIARWDFLQKQPWQQLGLFGQTLQGINAGGTQIHHQARHVAGAITARWRKPGCSIGTATQRTGYRASARRSAVVSARSAVSSDEIGKHTWLVFSAATTRIGQRHRVFRQLPRQLVRRRLAGAPRPRSQRPSSSSTPASSRRAIPSSAPTRCSASAWAWCRSNDPQEACGAAMKGFMQGQHVDTQQAAQRMKADAVKRQLIANRAAPWTSTPDALHKYGIAGDPELLAKQALAEMAPYDQKPGETRVIGRTGQRTTAPLSPVLEDYQPPGGGPIEKRSIQPFGPGEQTPGTAQRIATMGADGKTVPFTHKLGAFDQTVQTKLGEQKASDISKADIGKNVNTLIDQLETKIWDPVTKKPNEHFAKASGPFKQGAADDPTWSPRRMIYEGTMDPKAKAHMNQIAQHAQAIASTMQNALLSGQGAVSIEERNMIAAIPGKIREARSVEDAIAMLNNLRQINRSMFKMEDPAAAAGAGGAPPLHDFGNGVIIRKQVR